MFLLCVRLNLSGSRWVSHTPQSRLSGLARLPVNSEVLVHITDCQPHLLVIVPEVIIDGSREVQQEVPGVFGNGSFMMFLQKCVPQGKELEPDKDRVGETVESFPRLPLTFQP